MFTASQMMQHTETRKKTTIGTCTSNIIFKNFFIRYLLFGLQFKGSQAYNIFYVKLLLVLLHDTNCFDKKLNLTYWHQLSFSCQQILLFNLMTSNKGLNFYFSSTFKFLTCVFIVLISVLPSRNFVSRQCFVQARDAVYLHIICLPLQSKGPAFIVLSIHQKYTD